MTREFVAFYTTAQRIALSNAIDAVTYEFALDEFTEHEYLCHYFYGTQQTAADFDALTPALQDAVNSVTARIK